MNDKFDLTIPRSNDDRVLLALDKDCPVDVLYTMARYDTERDVMLAVAYNANVTPEIINVVLAKLSMTAEELQVKIEQYRKENVMNGLRSTFCPIPWNHVSTNPEGTVRACCQILDTNQYGTANIVKDDGTTLTGADDLTQHRNAPLWKSLRSQFIKGEKPELCKLCWDEESNGVNSHRQRTSKLFPAIISNAVKNTNLDGTIKHIDFPIEYWDLRFGNNCNLKCRTCSPVSSNSWYNDYIALASEEKLVETFKPYITIEKMDNGKTKITDTYNWYDDSKMWQTIIDGLDHTTRFYFTGGEPTINQKHKELLKIIIDRGLAKNINLDYNTNVAGIPSDMFNLWANFKTVNLGMSVDGIYEHFEYIRNPGKWSAAERTLQKIDSAHNLTNITAAFSVTVSTLNVLHILDMQWWMKEQNWKRIIPALTLHTLYKPYMYNIQYLPEEMKFYITKRYTQFINDIVRCFPDDVAFISVVRKQCSSVINYMNAETHARHTWNEFVEFSDRLDVIRGESWRESLSELVTLEEYFHTTRKQAPIIKLQATEKKI
jgi:hypothetical protein